MTTENLTEGSSGTPNNDAGEPNAEQSATQQASTTEGQQAKEGEVQQETQEKSKEGEQQLPETYDFAMPEGMELDTVAAEQFTSVAKELKLSQEQASKLTSIMVEKVQREADQAASLVEGWINEIKTDKEFGGDQFEQNLAVAQKAIDTFGSPELKAALNTSGMGNHPEVIKFAMRIGKLISEDKFVSGAPKSGETSLAKKMFPNMN